MKLTAQQKSHLKQAGFSDGFVQKVDAGAIPWATIIAVLEAILAALGPVFNPPPPTP